MSDFLKFFAEKVKHFPMHFELTYSKITDWGIYIYKRGGAEDYPESRKSGQNAVIVQVQDVDIEICCAKAYVALTDWLCEHEGGY